MTFADLADFIQTAKPGLLAHDRAAPDAGSLDRLANAVMAFHKTGEIHLIQQRGNDVLCKGRRIPLLCHQKPHASIPNIAERIRAIKAPNIYVIKAI